MYFSLQLSLSYILYMKYFKVSDLAYPELVQPHYLRGCVIFVGNGERAEELTSICSHMNCFRKPTVNL